MDEKQFLQYKGIMYDKVTFQIKLGQKRKLEQYAYDRNISVSELIRRALSDYVKVEKFVVS